MFGCVLCTSGKCEGSLMEFRAHCRCLIWNCQDRRGLVVRLSIVSAAPGLPALWHGRPARGAGAAAGEPHCEG